MAIANANMEKITISVPSELKDRVLELKNEFHTSISSLYKEAMEEYLKQKEIQKWQKAAELACKDEEYMKFVQEMNNSVDDIYEY